MPACIDSIHRCVCYLSVGTLQPRQTLASASATGPTAAGGCPPRDGSNVRRSSWLHVGVVGFRIVTMALCAFYEGVDDSVTQAGGFAAHEGPCLLSARSDTNPFRTADFTFIGRQQAHYCAWKMGYSLTIPASGKTAMSPKNCVWGFFRLSNEAHPANRRQPLKPRRKIRPTPTKSASGIPSWPSRDPIGERGGLDLYGFVRNDTVNRLDIFGRAGTFTVKEDTIEDGANPIYKSDLIIGMIPGTIKGFTVEYKADPSETCEKIKLVQVISFSGDEYQKPKLDSKRKGKVGYVEGGGYPFGETGYFDAPGARNEGENITFYLEACAFCCYGTPKMRVLGCVRFNFDNKTHAVIPRQDNATGENGSFEIPAYNTPTSHFTTGWPDWK